VDDVGAERSPVLVIDNFADDPQALIEQAAALAPFPSAERTFYTGARVPVPMALGRASKPIWTPRFALRSAWATRR
jgi:hypothetical protein